MHPQLQTIAQALDAAAARASRLVEGVNEGRFHRRPGGTRWSLAECLGHLNLTSRAFLPAIDTALSEARALGTAAPERYRRDPGGWLLEAMLEPPVHLRLPTTAPFQPPATGTREEILRAFGELQQSLRQRLEQADGLDLARVRIASPFNERLRYNLYSCFRILAAHQRRHLWQGEQALLTG
jgi:DinB superfamily